MICILTYWGSSHEDGLEDVAIVLVYGKRDGTTTSLLKDFGERGKIFFDDFFAAAAINDFQVPYQLSGSNLEKIISGEFFLFGFEKD